MKIKVKFLTSLVLLMLLTYNINMLQAQNQNSKTNTVTPERLTEFIHWYPAIKQTEMRDDWLKHYKQGEWQFTGMVSADDRTVITPQSDVNYGYSWFNISNRPVVITMPKYDKYYSLSVFTMNHFMEVYVKPDKPVVIRLPHQKSPIKDAIEIVINTYWGLAFTRQVIVNNEAEVMALAKKIKITGGGGDFPFIVPSFTKEEQAAGEKIIADYVKTLAGGNKVFGSLYEGVGDLDRAAGVMQGQLGTQARYVKYGLYVFDQNKKPLNGTSKYEIVIPKDGLIRDANGYWSFTIYNSADKYLIPNKQNKYNISSYDAKANADGTYTIHINPDGKGDNAIPTAGKNFYGIFRVYEPVNGIKYPPVKKIN
jgi:hypothetical protein